MSPRKTPNFWSTLFFIFFLSYQQNSQIHPPSTFRFYVEARVNFTSRIRNPKMATIPPPPSKRQKRETLALTQTQQDVTAKFATADAGSFKARFVDSEGNETDAVEIPLVDASEKNVSLLYNTLLV